MEGSPATPETTLALVLGAAEFPRTNLSGPPSLAESARRFIAYLTSEEGFGLSPSNLLNRFDTQDSPSRILGEIRDFLKARTAANAARPRDLIIYYVGHGGFANNNRDYFLALRSTERGQEGPSSLRIQDFAHTLNDAAPLLRKHLMLDACYSGEAYSAFSHSLGGTPDEAGVRKILEALPQHGTALLCSSSAADVSLAPKDSECTMFSGALLHALTAGADDATEALSLRAIRALAEDWIDKTFPGAAVRPEVHSPKQDAGDVADMPIFPNVARRRPLPARVRAVERRLDEVERQLVARTTDFGQLSAKVSQEWKAGLEELRAFSERTTSTLKSDLGARLGEFDAQLKILNESSQREIGIATTEPEEKSFKRYPGGFTERDWLEVPVELRVMLRQVSRARLVGNFLVLTAVSAATGSIMFAFLTSKARSVAGLSTSESSIDRAASDAAMFFFGQSVSQTISLLILAASGWALARSRKTGEGAMSAMSGTRNEGRALEYIGATRTFRLFGSVWVASPFLELTFAATAISTLVSLMGYVTRIMGLR